MTTSFRLLYTLPSFFFFLFLTNSSMLFFQWRVISEKQKFYSFSHTLVIFEQIEALLRQPRRLKSGKKPLCASERKRKTFVCVRYFCRSIWLTRLYIFNRKKTRKKKYKKKISWVLSYWSIWHNTYDSINYYRCLWKWKIDVIFKTMV